MKDFFNKHKKLIKVFSLILSLFLISLASMLLLNVFGILYFDEGIKLNAELFNSFKTTWYGCIFIIFLQIILTSLLSFVPGASMAFILLLQSLYDNLILAFTLSFTGVMLSSFMLYALGRFGGYNLCKKLLGEEDCQKASDLLNNKGIIYFPIMMLFPVFPDDALVMIAGTLKMSLKWFIPSIVIGRGIGVATIIFGFSIIPFEKFTSVWHWVFFVLACVALIVIVFLLTNLFNKYLEHKKQKKIDNK